MSNYTITTDFGAKDSLPSSNSAKVVRGSEFTTEFTNIQTAIATKADTAGDTFTGVVNFSADVAVNTNTLFVDVSAAKVGIGTTSPSEKLQVNGNIKIGDSHIIGDDGFDNLTLISSSPEGIVYGSNTDHIIKTGATGLDATGTERMRITSSGNVGIGTSVFTSNSIVREARIKSTATNGVARLSFTTTDNGLGASISCSSYLDENALVFGLQTSYDEDGASAPTERMRIDSSGNVLVGNTDRNTIVSNGASGVAIGGDGFIGASRTSEPLVLNREDSDGNIAVFRKDGTTVGSIGTRGGDVYLETGNTGIRMFDASNAIIPVGTTGVSRNGEVDLGVSNIRFRDLHLSGAGYIPDVRSTSNQYLTHNDGNFLAIRNSSGAERMRIDSSGNVGIGTTSPSAKLEVLATAPTYTNLGTVLWGGTTNNDNHTGISLSSSGDALGGSVGSNLYYSNSSTATQSNTNRSSGEIKIDNTTSTGTSTIRLGGYAKGTTTFDEHMRIDSSGDLMVGTTDENAYNGGFSVKTGTVPYINVGHASSVASGNYYAAFRHGTNTLGTITQNGTTGVLYNTSSDERLKENIADSADAGSKVDAIQIRQFDWKADGSHQDYGVIAQELVTVAPEAVHQPEDSEEMMGVDYSKLVPMLIKEVQSLRSRVAELENA